jgi:hypothetical protein
VVDGVDYTPREFGDFIDILTTNLELQAACGAGWHIRRFSGHFLCGVAK